MPIDFNKTELEKEEQSFKRMLDQQNSGQPNLLTKANPFDIVSAKARFSDFQRRIDLLSDEVETFEVDSDQAVIELTGILGSAGKLKKDLEKLQKKITDPYYDFYKSVLNFKNSFTDKLDFIIKVGKKSLGDYSYKKELERREAAKKAQEEIRRKQEELDRIADSKEIERVKIEDAVIEEKSGPVRTETGTMSASMKWDFEVVDIDQVPREFLRVEINKAKINEAIRSGMREISGLRIFESSKIQVRTV